MSDTSTQQKLIDILEPALASMSYELVDLEYRREERGWVVRLFIDRDGGISLDDCVTVSREVGVLLEVEDPVPHAYTLEVSSPGMDRVLKKPHDFWRFSGRQVVVKTHDLMDPDGRGHQRKTFRGELLGYIEEKVHVRQGDSKGGDVMFRLEEIDRAQLEPDF